MVYRYTSSDGDSFVQACVGNAPGSSVWDNQITCDGNIYISPLTCVVFACVYNSSVVCIVRVMEYTAMSCPTLTVANSDITSHTGSTTDSVLVTCSDGFTSSQGLTFTRTCVPDSSDRSNAVAWNNTELACEAIQCPALTVANSDATGVTGTTGHTITVGCVDGYQSSSGVSFVSTCAGTSPGVSEWTNSLTCDAMTCPTLTIANSNVTGVVVTTGTTVTATCAEGYWISSSSDEFTGNCVGTGPGTNGWSNLLTCVGQSTPLPSHTPPHLTLSLSLSSTRIT